MSKAVTLQDLCLLGVMDREENVFYAHTAEELNELIETHPEAIWIYNQSEQATETIDNLPHADGQESIEIFQDTEGVFGLRAYRQVGKMQTPVTLELHD